jgi:pilus assembly protein CpaE
VHILASPSRPESAEKVGSDQLHQLLRYLSRLYAYVIVDVNPYLTDVSISIMDTADAIVLVTTQEIPAITKNRLFLDFVTSLNISMEKIIFVMNKFDRRIAISPEKVGENLKQKVVTVIPLDDRTVIPAANKGVPFMQENKSQPAAKGIYQLAEALRTKLIQQGVQTLE